MLCSDHSKNMLLRSYSAPILNSWISRSTESSPESDVAKHSRNRSTSFAFEDHHPKNQNSRRTSGPDVRDRNPTVPNKKTSAKPPSTRKPAGRIKENGDPNSSKRLLSNSGLGEDVIGGRVEVVAENERVLVVMGGGYGGGGRRSDVRYGYGSYDPDYGYGHDKTDDYYQKMIEENPGSSLLLANYAKFLKEVKGDYRKAEEYCERAILGNRSECDGNLKCLDGDLIWKNQKDAGRAHIYFDEALKTDPNDCYVLASYARFLWDAEEDGQEGEEEEAADNRLKNSSKSPGKFFEGSSHQAPITAVS